MQVNIERGVLLKGLGHAQSAVEKRNTVPVLANVLLRAADDTLTLIAGDLDLEIRIVLQAQIIAPGALTAPAHLFHDIVRKLPDDTPVQLRHVVDEHRLQILSGRARFALPMLPEHDFPLMNFGGDARAVVLPAHDCARLFDKTRFAVSNEEVRYYLNGIYLHAAHTEAGTALRAVATDGHRLARCDAPPPADSAALADLPGVIVPRKTVNELRKLFEGNTDAAFELTDTKVRVTCGDVTLTSKLIDGVFPDYARAIPSNNNRIVTAETAALRRAVDCVATVCHTDKAPSVRLTLRPGHVEVSAGNESGNSIARDELEVDYDGPDMTIAFNVRSLIEILSHVSGRSLCLRLNETMTPVLIGDNDDPSVLFLLMPVRLPDGAS